MSIKKQLMQNYISKKKGLVEESLGIYIFDDITCANSDKDVSLPITLTLSP